MKDYFREICFPPVSAEQLASVGIGRRDLYWSGTFQCWRFCGDLVIKHPYATTGQILTYLGLTPDPRA